MEKKFKQIKRLRKRLRRLKRRLLRRWGYLLALAPAVTEWCHKASPPNAAKKGRQLPTESHASFATI